MKSTEEIQKEVDADLKVNPLPVLRRTDKCTSEGGKIEPCPLSEEIEVSHRKSRKSATEMTKLENRVFYNYPKKPGIETPASTQLRQQYTLCRTSMPEKRDEYINRLHELQELKERILVMEGCKL